VIQLGAERDAPVEGIDLGPLTRIDCDGPGVVWQGTVNRSIWPPEKAVRVSTFVWPWGGVLGRDAFS